MSDLSITLKPHERLPLALRAEYERFGYRHIHISQFAPYDLFVENKDFLKCDRVISFMDADGRILAMSPDATLSIAARMPAARLEQPKRLYYNEKVYRFGQCGIHELNQMGVELIGDVDSCACLDVILLAARSLETICPQYLLGVSHMGFVSGLLDAAGAGAALTADISDCVHQKNAHDLKRLLANTSIQPDLCEKIARLPLLSGPFAATLETARDLCVNDAMREALAELEGVHRFMREQGDIDRLYVDFSIVNNLDYYNGLILQGYVENLSEVVLTGGRYDHLMTKLGSENSAIGFAVRLDLVDYFG